MNLYGDVKSSWFDPTDSDPGDAEAKVDGRCRLRMLVLRQRGWEAPTPSTSLKFRNGTSTGDILYEVNAQEGTSSGATQSQVIDTGEHGVLFSDGIYADYTQGTVWCSSVTVIYS
jgi:hypothetical protein